MAAAPYFDLWMTPNRSLARQHAPWLVGGVALVMALGGVRLLLLGAWPVLPFMIIDVALLWWALRASYRSGERFEAVRLDDEALVVRRGQRGRPERRIRLEPFRAQVRLESLPGPDNRLWLTAGPQRILLGSFLSPAERAEVYGVVAAGLARWRGGR